MYCDKCKVKIEGKVDNCPLCHTPLTSNDNKEIKAFPLPQPIKINGKMFLLIYVIVMAVFMAPCITLNLYYRPDFLWCIIVLVILSYIGFFIRTVIIGKYRFIRNLTAQAFMLTILFFAIYAITKGNYWILIAWQPAVYIISYLILIKYISKSSELVATNITHIYILCILGQIPIFTAFLLPLSLRIPSIVASILGAIIFIGISIAYRKIIFAELKKFFHR